MHIPFSPWIIAAAMFAALAIVLVINILEEKSGRRVENEARGAVMEVLGLIVGVVFLIASVLCIVAAAVVGAVSGAVKGWVHTRRTIRSDRAPETKENDRQQAHSRSAVPTIHLNRKG